MVDLTLLHERAARRHGLVTVADLRSGGVGRTITSRWAADGRLHRVAHGVYRMAGAPPTVEADLLAAVLARGDGTCVSHASAAWLWDLPGIGRPARIDVVRPGGSDGRGPEGVKVYRSRVLPEHHRTVRRGIPVTTLSRTLFDMAGVVGPRMLDPMVEAALRTSNCTIGSLHHVLEDLATSGRPGVQSLRRVLHRRGRDYVPTESELDVLGRRVVAGIDGIEWQVELSDEQGYIRRVDGFHRASGVVIEWDGAEFHDRFRQRALDAAQDHRLHGMGLIVLRFRWHAVVGDAESVRATVLRHLEGSVRPVDGVARPGEGAARLVDGVPRSVEGSVRPVEQSAG